MSGKPRRPGSRSRRKGVGGEREWVNFLRKHGLEASRCLGQARDGGADVEAGGFLWEVKRRKHGMPQYAWLEQAAHPGRTPALAMRSDGKGWLVCMRAEDFVELLVGHKAAGS